jgi:low affinity Fe/Cu permease
MQAQTKKIDELLKRTKKERLGFVSLTKDELDTIRKIQDK